MQKSISANNLDFEKHVIINLNECVINLKISFVTLSSRKKLMGKSLLSIINIDIKKKPRFSRLGFFFVKLNIMWYLNYFLTTVVVGVYNPLVNTFNSPSINV